MRDNSLEERFPLFVGFDAKVINPVSQFYERGIKEGAAPAPLFQKVANTEPGLRIGIDKPLIARMHARGYSFRLPGLVGPDEAAVEDLIDQYPKAERIYRRVRSLLYRVPS